MCRKAGGLDLLTLDSLYEEGNRRNNQNTGYNYNNNPWEQQGQMARITMQQTAYDPFFASSAIAAPHSVQFAAMTNQQQAFFYHQQQHQMMMMMQQQQQQQYQQPFQQQAANPFSNHNVHPQAYNPYNNSLI